MQPALITNNDQLATLAKRCGASERIAVDVEGSGMHAYHQRLCVLQLAWIEDSQVQVAVVDPLQVDVTQLGAMLAATGPVKVLHDLTFDARMLHEREVVLGNVHDTSVAARFLGATATGLAALVKSRFEVQLSKAFQNHDWTKRPFSAAQIDYLIGDVRYLLDLDEQLTREAREKGIFDEVMTECDYKLYTALQPARTKEPHQRIKGFGKMPKPQQAALYHLLQVREEEAARIDKPPFRIAPNGLLTEMAKRRPRSLRAIAKMCQRKPHAAKLAKAWLKAIEQGQNGDGPPVAEPTGPLPPPRSVLLQRKRLAEALSAWRRHEAKRRDVDLQVVVPGHCMTHVASALSHDEADAIRRELKAIAGLGKCRVDRYAEPWLQLKAKLSEQSD